MKRAWLIALAAALLAAPAWAAEGLVLQLKDGEPAGSAGYLVARDRGYYAAEGLDVTIRPGRPGAEPLDALAAGATDLAVERMPAALVARERGLPVVNIAQPAGPEGLALVCWRRAGIADLWLLEADAAVLGAALRWEPASGSSRPGLFPHLYGALPLAAIRRALPVPLGADGAHCFPDGIP